VSASRKLEGVSHRHRKCEASQNVHMLSGLRSPDFQYRSVYTDAMHRSESPSSLSKKLRRVSDRIKFRYNLFVLSLVIGLCANGFSPPDALGQVEAPHPNRVLTLRAADSDLVVPPKSPKTDVTEGGEKLPLIDTDTLLYVDNRGLDRIFVSLNGHSFRLVADPDEVNRAANAFPIPRTGEITIHIGAFIEPGDGNFVRLASQGPPSADADVVIAPVFVRGQSQTAYAIRTLEPVPARFQAINYPNPFHRSTTIKYQIPAHRVNGVDVQIEVYDVLGRRIAMLEEGRRYPGTFERTWTPTPALSSGMYFARIRDRDAQDIVRMVVIR
jgi:hypothetical protein